MMTRSGYAARIKARILELQKMIEAAQSELHDLEVAQRVLDRLGDYAEPSYLSSPNAASKLKDTTKYRTIADVAIETLRENGPKSSSALLEIMQQQWRPDLALTTLASTLSRIGKNGDVKLVNGLWQSIAHDSAHEIKDLIEEETGNNLDRNAPVSSPD